MFGQRRSAKRFTLLLLEEGEDYVQDWVGTCVWPAAVSGNWQGVARLPGRIRLCTKSVFFEPDDVRVPIVRLPFASVKSLEPPATPAGTAATGAASPSTMRLQCTSCTKMKANLAETPYVHEHTPAPGAAWQLSLSYSPLAPLLNAVHELLAIAQLPGKMERTAALEALVRRREDAAAFDSSRLVDFSERLVCSVAAMQLTPLVRERGLLVVSDQRVYFQPLHNVSGGTPVRSHPLAGIAAVARRRSSLRPIGLELFFVDANAAAAAADATAAAGAGAEQQQQQQPTWSVTVDQRRQRALDEMGTGPWWDAPSAFFAFRSEQDREAVLAALTGQPAFGRAATPQALPPTPSCPVAPEPLLQARGLLLEAEGAWLQRVAAAWQHGKVSNFDYLLYLNLAAGRSFNDLAQWPVFPWVLCNYVTQDLDLNDPSNFRDLSKPVGALNSARLREFRNRYREMQTDAAFGDSIPPFMYGTHYSTPGYVMYWLVRAAPAHMLRLQNGHFDAPDRLFCSLQESWQCVNSSTTDVKELIPEFFLPQPDFLRNLQMLPLGVRQAGQPVGDVILPPWAGGSAARFLAINRAALEAPAVSASLHLWVDLVFGCKQRGPAAEAADNVFFYLTYEGAVDLSDQKDPGELKALETQINEFGQVPKQLFDNPHPARLVAPPAPNPDAVFGPGWLQAQQQLPHQYGAGAGAAGDGESGSRALALALLTTVMAAAAPEFAAMQQPPSPSTSAPLLSASPSGSAPKNGGLAAANTPAASPSPSSAAASAAAASSLIGRSSSLFASFLKLGRYTSQDTSSSSTGNALGKGSNSTATLGTSPAVPLAADSKPQGVLEGEAGPAGGCTVGVSSARNSAGGDTGQRECWAPASGAEQSEQEEEDVEDEGGGLLVSGNGKRAGVQATASTGQTSSDVAPVLGLASLAVPPPVTLGLSRATGVGDSELSVNSPCPAHILGPTPTPEVYCLSTDVGGTAGSWGMGLPRRLHERGSAAVRHVRLARQGRGPVTAVVLGAWGSMGDSNNADAMEPPGSSQDIPEASHNGTAQEAFSGGGDRQRYGSDDSAGSVGAYVYCVGHGGQLHVLPFHDPSRPLRSATLDGDLLCLVALRPSPPSGSSLRHRHPILLAGSHTCKVHAYSVDQGRLLGSWAAHDDAVCCALMTSSTPGAGSAAATHLVTSSWDCSVKVWSLAEGRCPWSGAVQLPEAHLQEFDAGVWAVSASAATGGSGGLVGPSLLVTGTEEGLLQAWDLRARGGGGGSYGTAAWQVQVADDYVGGMQVDPASGRFVVAATADGALTLLDVRMSGSRLARVVTGASPLRCCLTDGGLCVAGSEAGTVHLWDVALMSASGTGVGGPFSQPAPDGQYMPWQDPAMLSEPINGLALMVEPDGVRPGVHLVSESRQRSQTTLMALALESESVALLQV